MTSLDSFILSNTNLHFLSVIPLILCCLVFSISSDNVSHRRTDGVVFYLFPFFVLYSLLLTKVFFVYH